MLAVESKEELLGFRGIVKSLVVKFCSSMLLGVTKWHIWYNFPQYDNLDM